MSELYGEPFDIPNRDVVVFMSWFEGGEVYRSGCTWTRGSGRMFYFSLGHETYPIYHPPQIQRMIFNAVQWTRPQGRPASVPRQVPVAEACEKLTGQGPSVHDAGGRMVAAKS
jgi:trehalose utilization protein